jgi:carnitine O-acetyltransferase
MSDCRERKPPYFESFGNYADDSRFEDSTKPLYHLQSSLPTLPVPTLEETVERFLPSVLPFVETSVERDSLLMACENFPRQARSLQDKLVARKKDADKKGTSWLQEWWNTVGYLQDRQPNVLGISYFFRLTDEEKTSRRQRGISQAATALHAIYEYSVMVQRGEIPTDMLGDGKRQPRVACCATQYKYLFRSCRIPRMPTVDGTQTSSKNLHDFYRVHNPYQNESNIASTRRDPAHVVVACRNQFYLVPLTDEEGRSFSLRTLEGLLQKCLERSVLDSESTEAIELGWLTTTDRDQWSDTYYNVIRRDVLLSRSLDLLESAVCLLCLDTDDSPNSDDNSSVSLREQCLRYWHGNLTHTGNRWYDKTIQFVVHVSQGHMGLVGEHSLADGMPILGLVDHVRRHGVGTPEIDPATPRALSGRDEGRAELEVTSMFSPQNMQKYTYITLRERIGEAKLFHTLRVENHDLQVLKYERHGSSKIKQGGYSPDAYVQIAMQLAAYRLFGHVVPTYESAQTRRFLHGRTETIRSVSAASHTFCRAIGELRPESRPNERERLGSLLQAATDYHSQYARNAAVGLGVDRHFFGLSMVAAESGDALPDLMNHPSFLRSKRWQLSTSTLPNVAPGFGNVVE